MRIVLAVLCAVTVLAAGSLLLEAKGVMAFIPGAVIAVLAAKAILSSWLPRQPEAA